MNLKNFDMTQEEKQLLLRDISARLPYGVKIHIEINENIHIVGTATLDSIKSITGQLFDFCDFTQDFKNGDCCPISGFSSNKFLRLGEFKPYLRPMSSMTEEESMEFTKLFDKWHDDELFDYIEEGVEFSIWKHKGISAVVFDWLNKKMFDYRGLIPKGLTLEAPEEMYNTKTK